MKIFCAYAFTGEEEKEVTVRMRLVTDTLLGEGFDVYCNLFDPEYSEVKGKGVKAIFEHAFMNIKTCDIAVAIVSSERRSVGQLMELGVAMASHKPIYLMEHRSAAETTYLPN